MKKPPLYPVYAVATLREVLLEAVVRYKNKTALASKKHGKYQLTSYQQLGERVEEVATAFARMGLQKGDRVGILSENRTEWAVTYLAAVCSGLVAVPIDKDLKPREMRHILDYSGTGLLVCAADCVAHFRTNGYEPKCLQTLITMDDERGQADLTFAEALEQGYKVIQGGERPFTENQPEPEDMAAIIFTSGTMGYSKAVILTHHNLTANIIATSQMVSISNEDTLLSVLPLHHTYECTCGFLTALYQGATIYHAESLRRIADNLAECRGTVILGVPLLFDSIYRRIEKGIQDRGARKFKAARRLASVVEKVARMNIRRRLFKSLHSRFGGQLRLLICGGAAANPAVARGFRELGINFIQGYGMTEASPLISVNREMCLKDESVGLPIPGVEIRFDEGEILVRGPNVMRGYYLNEAATQEALRDGWLCTGDLGFLDEDGFLHINGRKKSLIVMPNGKNVYPEEVEALLNESPFVLESLVWGGLESQVGRAEVEAVIVPDLEAFDEAFGASQYDTEKVQQIISGAVKKCNERLANYKRIKTFTLREDEFEKTTTRKIKRYLYVAKQKPLSVGT